MVVEVVVEVVAGSGAVVGSYFVVVEGIVVGIYKVVVV